MHYILYCTDKPDSLALRVKTRPSHVVYLKSKESAVKLAGPRLDDVGDMIGTLLVIDVADRKAAQQFAAEDPYAKAGLFQSVEITAWRWVAGNPETV
jgi:uncharacterized protein